MAQEVILRAPLAHQGASTLLHEASIYRPLVYGASRVIRLMVGQNIDMARAHPAMRYVRNTGWLLVERFVSFPINLVVSIYVARYLGVESFGILSFATGLVALFSAIAGLGLDNILVRELVRKPRRELALIGTALWMRLISGVLAAVTIVLVAAASQLQLREFYVVLIVSISLVFQPGAVLRCFFEAKVKSKFIAQALLIQTLLSALLKVVLIASRAPLEWFAVVAVIDVLILSAALFLFYRSQSHPPRVNHWRFESATAKNLLRQSWPLLASGLALSVYMKIDQVMIRMMLDATEVGNYSAAVRISESWLVLAVILTTSLYPALISAHARSETLFRQRLTAFYSLMLWLSVLIATPMAIYSSTLIQLTFGEQYAAAAEVLAIHAWSGILVFLITASSRWYLTQDLETSILFRALLGALINVVLNLVLIPTFGIKGAAYATLISYAFMAVLYDLLDPRGRPSFRIKAVSVVWPVLKVAGYAARQGRRT